MEGLEASEELEIETPFGAPSDRLRLGRIGDLEVGVLGPPRPHHKAISPSGSALPGQTSGAAAPSGRCAGFLLLLGVFSLQEPLAPLTCWLGADQFIDRTHQRPISFSARGARARSRASPIPSVPLCRRWAMCREPDATGPPDCTGAALSVRSVRRAFSTRRIPTLYRGAWVLLGGRGVTRDESERRAWRGKPRWRVSASRRGRGCQRAGHCWRRAGDTASGDGGSWCSNLRANRPRGPTYACGRWLPSGLLFKGPLKQATHTALRSALMTPKERCARGAHTREAASRPLTSPYVGVAVQTGARARAQWEAMGGGIAARSGGGAAG